MMGNALEAVQILDREKIALVVLCHSLRDEEAAMIVEKARQKNDQTKTLLIVADVSRDGVDRNAGFDAAVLPDPARLLQQVAQLLQP